MKTFLLIILISLFGGYTYSQIPNPPVLISPQDSALICILTPSLDWSDVTGATSYRLQISKHLNFDTLVLDAPGLTNSGYQVLSGLLTYNTTYYWRVNVTTSGGTSNWSTIWRFTTGPPLPPVPVTLQPIIDTSNMQIHVIFRWRVTNYATSYRLQISTDSTFAVGIRDTTTSDTIITLSGFTLSTRYYWRLRAMNICGYSPFSSINYLVINFPPAAPMLLVPPNGALNVSLTTSLLWTSVPGATYYRLQVAYDSTFLNKVLDSIITGSFIFPPGILCGQTIYYWRVCAGNGIGQGPWSINFHFTTVLSPPPVIYAPPEITTSPVFFDWSDIPGALSYTIQISIGPSFTNIIVDTSGIIPSFIWLSLPPGSYYWRLRAVTNCGIYAWISVLHFTVVPSFSISGTVRYNDNNQLVTSGIVKAFQLNKTNGSMVYFDSAQIQSNGTYILNNVPQDSVDIGVFPNSTPPNDYVITYYPSTIYWQNAIVLYPTSNLTNIDIAAIRMFGTVANNSVNGKVTRLTDLIGNIKDAFLYAKIGNSFVRCAFSDSNGVYHLQSLPSGNLKIIVNRLGFSGDSTNVNVPSTGNIDSINFYLNKIYVGLKRIDGGVPSEYKLYQNYPNPFNPVTIIKFMIAQNGKSKTENGLVTLRVYDILGREVATLVNERLQPGTYEIPFSVNRFSVYIFPSGVYFYRLEVTDPLGRNGNFTDTKRMVLLK